MDPGARTEPALDADETAMLRGWLGYHRDTLRWKCAGLTQEQLARPLPPSSLTLGGLMKHLAVVESHWFEVVLDGGTLMPPFDTVDWDADPDWEFRTAADDGPEELAALLDEAIARADKAIDAALAGPTGLDTLSVRTDRRSHRHFSVRWILTHMIEEYARHNGHADLIRESVDGVVGD